MKDDSGSYAVFTEQGSSASQMTAAKVMDIISRLPGCSGQAADAVSAYTQVKMADAPIWENQHHASTMFNWVALKENVRSAMILWIITEVFRIKDFCQGYRKIVRNKKHGET